MKEIYQEIFTILDNYKDYIVFDIDSLKRQSEAHLFGVKLREEYGLNIDPKRINRPDYVNFDDSRTICVMGRESSRTISWSDDGKQPDNELMLVLSFPTGAYIFGQDYPTKIFKQFFEELKNYHPKYSDTNNHNLYYPIEYAKDIFNSFPDILKKYRELNKEDYKLRKIEELKSQLEKLEQ